MEHDEDVLKGLFEERGVFVDFLALEEPVGVFVPDGVVEEFDGFGKAVLPYQFVELLFAVVEFAADPVFAHVEGGGSLLTTFRSTDLGSARRCGRPPRPRCLCRYRRQRLLKVRHQTPISLIYQLLDEAGDVPEFVAEIAAGDDFAGVESLVDAGGSGGNDTKAEGVGAVLGDDFHGIDDVEFAFGHFLAFVVEDEAVEVDVFEGNLVGGVEAEHDHAGDPSE